MTIATRTTTIETDLALIQAILCELPSGHPCLRNQRLGKAITQAGEACMRLARNCAYNQIHDVNAFSTDAWALAGLCLWIKHHIPHGATTPQMLGLLTVTADKIVANL